MAKEVIYKLTLDIKDSNLPFTIKKSISSESGDLIKVFSSFQLYLIQLLEEIHNEEINEIREERKEIEDDIPF